MFVEEKSKGEVPDFKLGTLRLSTAIRIGASKREQCTGLLFKDGRSCALGAAYEAFYGHPGIPHGDFSTWIGDGENNLGNMLWKAFPALRSVMYGSDWLNAEVYRRNDKGDTREEIADWLERQGL